MYKLRLAEEADIDVCLVMGERFYETTNHAGMIPFNEDSASAQFFHMLDHGFIILAEHEQDGVIGMMGCNIFDFPWNMEYKGCAESMLWLEPEHRHGGLAAEMMKQAELLAIGDGAQFVVMAALESSPEGIDKWYNRLGYSRSERAFIKGI